MISFRLKNWLRPRVGCRMASTMDRLERLKKTQRCMQLDDCKPIYLKAGARDRILYIVTMGLALFGLEESIRSLLDLAGLTGPSVGPIDAKTVAHELKDYKKKKH